MKVSLISFVGLFISAISGVAQCVQLEIDKVDETPLGNTYRIYSVMKNEGDMVLAVFGDSANVLSVSSTKPFYQNPEGGALSTSIRKNKLEVSDSLKYDSWLTIGRTDNYENNLMILGLDTKEFESTGGSIICKDGAWYCLPIDAQSKCDSAKRVLLMQLTTKGKISGNLSVMGKNASGENFQSRGHQFMSQ
jgi:hypothetical protein